MVSPYKKRHPHIIPNQVDDFSMNKFPNDREYIRVVKPYIVRFRVKADETLNMISKEWDMVTTNNFSAKGIFFFANRNLEVGTILELKIGFSLSHPSIICVGKVIRTRRHMGTSTIGFAIVFTEIDEQIKKEISNIVSGIVTHNSHLAARIPRRKPGQA